jgi:succinoglycan biosynthesis protein ExoM
LHGSETKVCILICTCDRPAFLEQLLEQLTGQVEGYPVVVVDNGLRPSETVVSSFKAPLNTTYDRLAAKGLVVARNRAISLALAHRPEILVFIDDDEVPLPGWLSALVGCLETTGADIVTGPVVPEFLTPPPSWAVRGKFFFREPGLGAGNLAIRRTCLPDSPDQWFRPAFNFLGAEDEEFLKRLLAGGATYAAADAAVVKEFVPADRMRRRFIWRTGLRDGVQSAALMQLQTRSRTRRAGRLLLGCGAKIGYALNHLFWSVTTPWRVHFAIRDFAAAAGILLGGLGVRFTFYGIPGSHELAETGPGP